MLLWHPADQRVDMNAIHESQEGRYLCGGTERFHQKYDKYNDHALDDLTYVGKYP